MSEAPLIIEVRVNETALRSGNAALPYSPQEIVQQARLAVGAGASIVHWHGRDPVTGEPRNDIELYLGVAERLRPESDVILHPTLGYITQEAPEERLAHIAAADGDPLHQFDLAPVEFGSVNVDFWDATTKRFLTGDRIYANRTENIERVLRRMHAMVVRPTAVVWDVGDIRTARCFAEMGLLPDTTLWELVFTGERVPAGTPPTEINLQAMLQELPDGAPWLVLCWNGDVLQLADEAISRGGHVAIGLGDWPHPTFGTPDHARLVSAIAAIAERHGRSVATPGQARERLALPPVSSAA